MTVVEAAGQKVTTASQLAQILARAKAGSTVLLRVSFEGIKMVRGLPMGPQGSAVLTR